MNKIVIGLSGGMDSATLLGYLLEQGMEVHCCAFNYGSKHNEYENAAVEKIVEYYQSKRMPVYLYWFPISPVMHNFKSALLLNDAEDIPEGHYASENMKKTVVPGRNLIFSSIMAGLAESIKAEAIALGVHSGDHFIYPDCRTEFIKALDTTVYLSSDRKVQVITPFSKLDKYGILKIGYKCLPVVPYELTRTCYKNQPLSCGKCGSCNERLEAFELLNLKDPIPYE